MYLCIYKYVNVYYKYICITSIPALNLVLRRSSEPNTFMIHFQPQSKKVVTVTALHSQVDKLYGLIAKCIHVCIYVLQNS